jgi:hypothetical protein
LIRSSYISCRPGKKERDLIVTRTREALPITKAPGVKLGNPNIEGIAAKPPAPKTAMSGIA